LSDKFDQKADLAKQKKKDKSQLSQKPTLSM
jgi:hypothetical protein